LIYLDTSFIVSLYGLDVNTVAAVALMRTVNEELLITSLVELETINAFGLKEFRKEFTSLEAEASLLNFDKAVRAGVFQLRALPEAAFGRARTLSRRLTPQLGTRTAGILHVAAALDLGATDFYSFDLQQRKMAQAAGLATNPWP